MTPRRTINVVRLEKALLIHQQKVDRLHICIGQGCAELIAKEYEALRGTPQR